MTTTTPTPSQLDARPGRPDWLGYTTVLWAAGYAVLALTWTITGRGFPFGRNDPDSFGTLRGLPADIGAPAFVALLIAVAVVALIMTGAGQIGRAYRAGLLGCGWLAAAVLLVVVPEPTVLALAGYAPLLLVGAPFGWPPEVDYSAIFTWPLLNQAIALTGGFLVAGTVLRWQRRTAGGCPRCGRGDRVAGWTSPAAAARWGRWAVAVAVAVPVGYAVTRLVWLVGIPLLADQQFVDQLHETGDAWAGAWLAGFGLVGAVLTLGLVQRWGERFPRWLLGLAGRRVPISLAVAPALLVSALVTSAGLGFASDPEVYRRIGDGDLVALPSLAWPIWGAALAAAAFAYAQRRGRCRHPL